MNSRACSAHLALLQTPVSEFERASRHTETRIYNSFYTAIPSLSDAAVGVHVLAFPRFGLSLLHDIPREPIFERFLPHENPAYLNASIPGRMA